jgi:hypothetical protein
VSGKGAKQRIFVQVGQRFGRLVVQNADARMGVKPSKPAGWRAAVCVCDCGNRVTVALSNLNSGASKSCGCWQRELGIRHGLNGHPLRPTWAGMMERCHKESARQFPRYGGRGIKVCDRWHDLTTFVADIESSIGPRPEGRYQSGMPLYTLDRIDNDGNYEPGNVRWATALQQRHNRQQRPARRAQARMPQSYRDVLAWNVTAQRAKLRLGGPSVAARMQALGFKTWHRQTVSSAETGERVIYADELLGLALSLQTTVLALITPPSDVPTVTLPSGDLIVRERVTANDGTVGWDGNRPELPDRVA